MPYPRHEAQLERDVLRSCLYLLQHPSEFSSTLRESYHRTRDYYAGRDLVDLERGEIIQIVSWTRKMALKMAGSSMLLLVFLFVALFKPCKAVQTSAPDDFG